MSFVAPWRSDRSLLARLILSRHGEVRPFWGWSAVVMGIGLMLLALVEILTILLALQGISLLRLLFGSQSVIWLVRHLP